jgi:hypothetical protein
LLITDLIPEGMREAQEAAEKALRVRVSSHPANSVGNLKRGNNCVGCAGSTSSRTSFGTPFGSYSPLGWVPTMHRSSSFSTSATLLNGLSDTMHSHGSSGGPAFTPCASQESPHAVP